MHVSHVLMYVSSCTQQYQALRNLSSKPAHSGRVVPVRGEGGAKGREVHRSKRMFVCVCVCVCVCVRVRMFVCLHTDGKYM